MTTAVRMRRREMHAAKATSYSTDGAKQILMAYRGNKHAAVTPGFEFKPGFIYCSVRAISARINQNFDGWPSSELIKSYRTFLGKPCFVNHQNFDPKKARGKVVAARYVEAGDDKYVETVMEIDAQRFPKLAKEIKEGGLDSVSMGVEAGFTICSYCGNKAVDVPDFCEHVKYHKGQRLGRINEKTGAVEPCMVYEKCYKLGFFELSFVFDPADETAVVSRVIAAAKKPDLSGHTPTGHWHQVGYDAYRNDGPRSPLQHPDVLDAVAENPPGHPNTKKIVKEYQQGWAHGEDDAVAAAGIFPKDAGKHEQDENVPSRGEVHDLVTRERYKGYSPGAKPTPHERKLEAYIERLAQDPAMTDQTQNVAPGSITPGQMPTELPPTELPPTGMDPSGMMPTAMRRTAKGKHEGPPDHPFIDLFRIKESPEWKPLPENYRPKHVKEKSKRDFGDFLKNQTVFEARINRLAYGEVEAPEDVDTLDAHNDTDDPFKRWVKPSPKDEGQFQNPTPSPPELQGPDMDQAKRLDRDQEQEGLDTNRGVEDVESISGPPTQQGVTMSSRNARRRRPRYAQDEDPMAALMGGGGGDPSMDPSMGGGDPSMGGPPPDDGGGGQSDEELIAEAEQDLQMAEQGEGGDEGGPPPEDEGDEYSDEGDEDEDYPPEDEGEEEGDFGEEDEGMEPGEEEPPQEDEGDGSDLPPWLAGGGEEDSGPPPPPELTARRRNGNRRSSTQKKRRKGTPMSLATRTRVAAAQRPRHHYADDSGHFDGGPYDENNQGQWEGTGVMLSETPSAESVSAPTPGDGTISNTENNLVARIQRRSNDLRRDMIAYEQITGRRIQGVGTDEGAHHIDPAGTDVFYQGDPLTGKGFMTQMGSNRYAETTAPADAVDPPLSGTDDQSLKSDDHQSLDEGVGAETAPHDASRHAFRAFDTWLQQTTGRTARQHANSNFIRRSAARFCSAKGWDPAVMFPALGTVLREARRNEGTNRRSAMRRYADESLDVAAPQDRIDVEAPVSDTTDADAQASQFDLGDFGSNAGDDLADPELGVDTQIWAPGEGESSVKNSNRKADGITAVRYAEAYIRAGLAPNTSEEKWKIAGLAQTMRLATIRDRIGVLDAVNQVRAASARRTAGINRGAGRSVPPGFGQRQLTAGNAANSANDIATDSAMFLK